ncbi:unnamed protein product [Trifolium pratense]|uniref:Uncharacterized protein n=1 Tax=Trifolium pratense TaxID=57577 RepID=A0ACB0JDZ9_TRIPR|nr:unnamed protein product [Trifolium pratense]
MNSCLLASSLQPFPHTTTKSFNLLLTLRRTKQRHFLFISSKFNSPKFISSSSSSNGSNIPSNQAIIQNDIFHSEVTNPQLNSSNPKLSFGDQAFFLLAFIACTAMRNAAISFSKLADTAREELPSTMTAVRLSGMEISDLTLELSDLSQEITDGISKSAQALQAAETGIRQIGSVAQQHTISMIEERANLPEISLQPVVAGAARKTSRAVGRATKSLMNMISGRQSTTENDDDITYI